jgi:predicted nuclease of predicted toxin-antitoxin system
VNCPSRTRRETPHRRQPVPRIAAALHQAGYQTCHVIDVGLGSATDEQILAWAADNDRVIISSDTDFSAILAHQRRSTPSFVLLRHLNDLTPDEQTTLLLDNLPAIAGDLVTGAVVTMLRDRIRVRALPFRPSPVADPDPTTP